MTHKNKAGGAHVSRCCAPTVRASAVAASAPMLVTAQTRCRDGPTDQRCGDFLGFGINEGAEPLFAQALVRGVVFHLSTLSRPCGVLVAPQCDPESGSSARQEPPQRLGQHVAVDGIHLMRIRLQRRRSRHR